MLELSLLSLESSVPVEVLDEDGKTQPRDLAGVCDQPLSS